MLWAFFVFLALDFVAGIPKPDHKTVSEKSGGTIVTTPLGTVQGAIAHTRNGKEIFAFKGVRYAKAPIEDLRFQPPKPVEKWDGVFNATMDGPACPQPNVSPISEDCLLLNVYTSKG